MTEEEILDALFGIHQDLERIEAQAASAMGQATSVQDRLMALERRVELHLDNHHPSSPGLGTISDMQGVIDGIEHELLALRTRVDALQIAYGTPLARIAAALEQRQRRTSLRRRAARGLARLATLMREDGDG